MGMILNKLYKSLNMDRRKFPLQLIHLIKKL